MDDRGRAAGEAYVELKTEDDLRAALKMHKEHIGSRWIEVFRRTVEDIEQALAKPVASVRPNRNNDRRYREDRSSRHRGRFGGSERKSRSSRELDIPSIKMRGFPFSSTERDVSSFLNRARVVPTKIHLNARVGQAYAELETKDDVRRALRLHKEHIGSRYIEVFSVHYSEVEEAIRPEDHGYRRDFDRRRDVNRRRDRSYERERNRNNSPSRYGHQVELYGLSFETTERDVADFFRGFHYIPGSISLSRTSRGTSEKGCIGFKDIDEAYSAIEELDGRYIGNRYIKLRLQRS